jgi:hypothetical protein
LSQRYCSIAPSDDEVVDRALVQYSKQTNNDEGQTGKEVNFELYL